MGGGIGLARMVAGAIALLAWSAIFSQLAINFGAAPAKGIPLWRVPVDLFGYFTIWSNTLVALVTGWFALGKGAGLLGRPGTLGATVVYIVVVGVIYNTLLVQYNPQVGVRLVIDTVFHTVVPLAYTLWWFVLVPRGRLGWNALLPALIFPTVYSFWAMGKGAVTGKYAYFFIDVGKYGAVTVLVNIAALALLYAVLMAGVIAWDRRGLRGTAAA
nr:Pr6Pr family membrane protein [Polymorphobacter sp.]